MSNQPRTREELYQRIRETSKEEFILSDMIRLGFWPAQGEMPQDPADEIRRRGEISRELNELRKENRHLYNEQALLKEMRRKRLEESRRKQQENKERREKERLARAAAWLEKKREDITYLGADVSAGLNNRESDHNRLQTLGLTPLNDAAQIAQAMGITIGQLRFLAFSRQTSTTNHYVRFKIPKKTGGVRLISAPMPRLKEAQAWILNNVLEKIALHEVAHGFRTGYSIVTNAKPHLAAEVVVNFDLKDFFPSISYRRVKGMFHKFGYSEAVATIFALICTEPDVEEVTLDEKKYFVALNGRHLPQGAPSSPAITNILCRRLDKKLTDKASEFGFSYTRYADDLTFSASGDALKNICNMMSVVRDTVAYEGFAINEEKTRVLRRSRQQEVTGIIVNDRLNVDRETLKKFRATLYQIEKDGPEGKFWGHSKDVMASIRGFANFVYMVDAEKGRLLQQKVKMLIDKYGWKPAPRPSAKTTKTEPPSPSHPPEIATIPATEDTPKAEEKGEQTGTSKKWWKLW